MPLELYNLHRLLYCILFFVYLSFIYITFPLNSIHYFLKPAFSLTVHCGRHMNGNKYPLPI